MGLTTHVRHMTHIDKDMWAEEQAEIKNEWPEYRQSTFMLVTHMSIGSYTQSDKCANDTARGKTCLYN
eukprot:3663459-Amphidinium_carterae.1